MSSRVPARIRTDERGLTSVGILLAVSFTMMVAVLAIHVFLYLYGQGAARAAIDEGVRAGSRVGSGDAACERRAAEALDSLMPGPLGDGVELSCYTLGNDLVAVANVTFNSPLPGVPSWSFRMEAHAVQETGE